MNKHYLSIAFVIIASFSQTYAGPMGEPTVPPTPQIRHTHSDDRRILHILGDAFGMDSGLEGAIASDILIIMKNFFVSYPSQRSQRLFWTNCS